MSNNNQKIRKHIKAHKREQKIQKLTLHLAIITLAFIVFGGLLCVMLPSEASKPKTNAQLEREDGINPATGEYMKDYMMDTVYTGEDDKFVSDDGNSWDYDMPEVSVGDCVTFWVNDNGTPDDITDDILSDPEITDDFDWVERTENGLQCNFSDGSGYWIEY